MAARKMRIEFGLLSVACRRESAVEAEVKPVNLCLGQEGQETHAPSPLRQDPSYCPTCGPVEKDRIAKGVGSGTDWTVLTAEQIDALSEAKLEFGEHATLRLVAHPATEFLTATETGAAVYYVTPEATDADHYALLTQVVGRHPELAFAGLLSLSTGGRAKLWLLRVRDGVLVLEQREREQSLKPTPTVGGEVNEKLLAMMEGALESFVEAYVADEYEDRYATALAKALGEAPQTEGSTPVATKPSDEDLMAKLAALQGGQ